MDSNIKTINISVELCGILMCLMGVIVVLIGRRMEKKTSRYFTAIFSCLVLAVLTLLIIVGTALLTA